MEPIRILHENVELEPGGIESLLMNVYRNIDRNKVQFDFLLHRSYEGAYEKEVLELGGRIYKTPPFNPFHHKKYLNGIKSVLSEHPEYKVIHAHSDLNYWPLHEAKKLGVPVRIAHAHNAKTVINLKYFFFLYERLFMKNVCTNFFACSEIAANFRYGEKFAKNNDVVTINNGVEVEKYIYNKAVRSEIRSELNIGENFVVGHVGRFMEPKNHLFLVEIFSEFLKIQPNAKLMLVGQGSLKDNICKKAEELGVLEKIIFAGLRLDVERYLQAMDVFVFPSLWEGLPLTVVEAQSAGLPVVMSDVITDEVCLTTLISKVPLKDTPTVWAQKIKEKLTDFVRTDISDEVIKGGFDIKSTADWLQQFYIDKYNRC